MDRSRAGAAADVDERLARLAARRAGSDAAVALPRRRGHPAAATRVLVAGLSVSAFLSIVASLGATAPASGASTTSVVDTGGALVSGTGPRPTRPEPVRKEPP